METQHGQRQPGIWLLRAVFVCSRQMWSAIGRSLTVATMVLLAAAWSPQAIADPIDKSDMNNDGAVNVFDLEIFANTFLEQDWMTVNWCSFYEATQESEKYFREITSDRSSSYEFLLDFIRYYFFCAYVDSNGDLSDLTGDGLVDQQDLEYFSTAYLETNAQLVDWCSFYAAVIAGEPFNGRNTGYYLDHFVELLAYINTEFNCSEPPPPPVSTRVENVPQFLYRIVHDPVSGNYYVTDPIVGSLFIYDSNWVLTGEIKGLNNPLGVAVTPDGNVLVGNSGRNNIEKFDPLTGELLAVIAEGVIKQPNAILVHSNGYTYVADSRLNTIWVLDVNYSVIDRFGKPGDAENELHFPADIEIFNGELFVADQGHTRVQVFGLDGTWIRNFGFSGVPGQNCHWWTKICEIPGVPAFKRIQSLEFDALGRLHVLDKLSAVAVIFDRTTGAYQNKYGEYGTEVGQLKVPTDIFINSANQAVVPAGDGSRLEFFSIP